MTQCIQWAGRIRADGRAYTHKNGRMIEANRYIYELNVGQIPPTMCVRHTCGNRNCVNIEHLCLSPRKIPLKDRFFKYVKIPEDKNACWIWVGRRDKDGYGCYFSKEINTARAHRISYYLEYGDFDRSLCVCHSCDNPSCVNPKHLWLGTIAENTKDSEIKGRQRRNAALPILYGKNNHKTKLTENQVREIRHLSSEGLSYVDLSKIYSMSAPTIRSICLRKIWKWIDE
jgi:hypothetical protein